MNCNLIVQFKYATMHYLLPRKSNLGWFVASFVLIFSACNPDDSIDVKNIYPDAESLRKQIATYAPNGNLNYFIFPESTDYSSFPNTDPANPITKEKVELGRLLFFETALGLDPANNTQTFSQTYSCATCHIPEFGFTPGNIQGIADGGLDYGLDRTLLFGYPNLEADVQGHRPLSMVNVSYITNGMWNGMFGATHMNINTQDVWETNLFAPATAVNAEGLMGLEAQNIEGMGLHRLVVNDYILNDLGYQELFDAAFEEGEVNEHPERLFSFAVSAYLRSIYANEAPFQDFLKGDDNALSPEERLGASLFFDVSKTKCVSCHNLPSLGGQRFAKIGTKDMHEANADAEPTVFSVERNLGRGGFTMNESDNYKFKVPQLYNTADYGSYFHGSSKYSLDEVLEYKIQAKSENSNVPDFEMEIRPITDLTDLERDALLAFLTNSLRDKNLERYMPESLPSGNCFPNNDLATIGNTNNNRCD